MRTRSRPSDAIISNLGNILQSRTDSTDNSTVGPFSYPREDDTLFESTEEIVDKDPSEGFMKTVSHTKTSWKLEIRDQNSILVFDDNPQWRYFTSGAGIIFFNFRYSNDAKGRVSPNDLRLVRSKTQQELLNSALHELYSPSESLNLVNLMEIPKTIASLKQIASLHDRTVRILQDTDRLLSNKLGWQRGGIYSRPFKDILRRVKQLGGKQGAEISNMFLAYQFGFAPLVSDIRKTTNELFSNFEKTRKAVKSLDKRLTIHRSASAELRVGVLHDRSRGIGRDSSVSGTHWHPVIKNPEANCSVTLRGVRKSSFETKLLNSVNEGFQKYIARGPASLIWELIPYSFVADWFFDLSGLIDGIDDLLTGHRVYPIDACYSEKFTCDVDSVHHRMYADSDSLHEGYGYTVLEDNLIDFTLAKTHISKYTRKPIRPDSKVILKGLLGKKQLALMGALFHQTAASNVRYR